MTEAQFTELETKAIAAFSKGFNYDNAASEIADNATALSVEEIAEAVGVTVPQAKGVVGSLTKKGLLDPWDEPDMTEFTLWITEKGINTHYDLKAA